MRPDEEKFGILYDSILDVIRDNNLDCADVITLLLCIQCSVCISIKHSKKEFVEILNALLSKIPADEFYYDEVGA